MGGALALLLKSLSFLVAGCAGLGRGRDQQLQAGAPAPWRRDGGQPLHAAEVIN